MVEPRSHRLLAIVEAAVFAALQLFVAAMVELRNVSAGPALRRPLTVEVDRRPVPAG